MARPGDHRRARDAATSIVKSLRDAGYEAYFAGGCVRDELLGLDPSDYDVATSAKPGEVLRLFPRSDEVGAAFGVVLVREMGVSVEVATFRADGPYSDARRPDSVAFSDARHDALRRDFTVNALFMDPFGTGPEGRVIDYVGGQNDLIARTIRAVGNPDDRLKEDHLRALRAVRFAARLGFTIDAGTGAAIGRHASELKGVSRERIGEELRKMLTHPRRAEAAEELQVLGLDSQVFDEPPVRREVTVLRDVDATGGAGSPTFACALAAWAVDRFGDGPNWAPLVARWRRALCLSNDESAELAGVLRDYSVLTVAGEAGGFESWGVALQRRAAAGPWFEGAMRLLRTAHPSRWARVRGRADELAASAPGLNPAPLVTGDDLIAAGMTPGPRFKKVLDDVYDAQLEGRIVTKGEGMELVRILAG